MSGANHDLNRLLAAILNVAAVAARRQQWIRAIGVTGKRSVLKETCIQNRVADVMVGCR